MAFLRRNAVPLALFALVILAYCFNPLKEPDAFYHLRTGQLIWEIRQIPHADVFSYTAPGAPWVAHEWLAELIFYGAYALSGYWGLMALVAALGLLTFALVARIARRPGVPLAFTLLAVTLLGYLMLELWIPRPQVLAFLLCPFLLWLLQRYRANPHAGYLLGIGAVMLAWANLHASFILGLVLIAWQCVALATMRLFPRLGTAGLSRKAIARLWVALPLVAALCLLNPTGYHAFLYWRYVQPAVAQLNIFEWRSILAFGSLIQAQAMIALMILSAGFVTWWHGVRRQSRDLVAWGTVVGITILPFISIRHVGFWAVGALPFVVAALGSWLAPRLQRLDRRWLWGAGLLLAALLLGGRVFTFPRQYFLPARIPVYAADFVERVGLTGPLFNLYNEGGYLIWRFYPQEKVAIDGRSEVYAGNPLRIFLQVVKDGPRWHDLVDERYKVNYFFLAYNPPSLKGSIQPLLDRLKADGWVLVYWDDAIVIYVRDVPENAAIIAEYGARHVDPFGDPTAIPAADTQAAAAELKRITEMSDFTTIPLEYARRFLQSR